MRHILNIWLHKSQLSLFQISGLIIGSGNQPVSDMFVLKEEFLHTYGKNDLNAAVALILWLDLDLLPTVPS